MILNRTLTEQKVLNKLGISDFRHMTKDKIVKFASMLPYMDPEVAKKALEQFPAYTEMSFRLLNEYKEMLHSVVEENTVRQNMFYESCNTIINSLQKELLTATTLAPEEREKIEDKMICIAKMISEKDTENKQFFEKLMIICGITVVGIIGITASILGVNTYCKNGLAVIDN